MSTIVLLLFRIKFTVQRLYFRGRGQNAKRVHRTEIVNPRNGSAVLSLSYPLVYNPGCTSYNMTSPSEAIMSLLGTFQPVKTAARNSTDPGSFSPDPDHIQPLKKKKNES